MNTWLSTGSRCPEKPIRFTLEGISSGFPFALEVAEGIVRKLELSGQDFLLEKQRIKAEIREKEERSSPRYAFTKAIWQGSSAEQTVLGYCGVLDRVSLRRLKQYRREVFSRENCYFVLTGNPGDSGVGALQELARRLDAGGHAPVRVNEVSVPTVFFHRTGEIRTIRRYWSAVYLGFDLDMGQYSPEVLSLLYQILIVGESALLYRHLSEDHPLIYGYDSVLERYNNAGNLSFHFEVSEKHTEEALTQAVEAINRLKRGDFPLEANRNQMLADLLCLADDPRALNWHIGYEQQLLNPKGQVLEGTSAERLSWVTVEQIQNAARDIFRKQNLTILLQGPSRLPEQKAQQILSRLEESP